MPDDRSNTTVQRALDVNLLEGVLDKTGRLVISDIIAAARADERERCAKRAFDAMHHGTFNQKVLDAIRGAQ